MASQRHELEELGASLSPIEEQLNSIGGTDHAILPPSLPHPRGGQRKGRDVSHDKVGCSLLSDFLLPRHYDPRGSVAKTP